MSDEHHNVGRFCRGLAALLPLLWGCSNLEPIPTGDSSVVDASVDSANLDVAKEESPEPIDASGDIAAEDANHGDDISREAGGEEGDAAADADVVDSNRDRSETADRNDGDAGLPEDGPAACSCSLPDAARAVRYGELSCLCQFVECPTSSYDVTLEALLSMCRSAPPSRRWEQVFTVVYQGCGLLGITPTALDSDTPTWIFDASTRAFVGMIYGPWSPNRPDPCGQGPQWWDRISGGSLPASSCTEVTTREACWEGGTSASP